MKTGFVARWLLSLLLLIPSQAIAQGLTKTVEDVSVNAGSRLATWFAVINPARWGPSSGTTGLFAINNIAFLLVMRAWLLIDAVAILFIVRAGLKLINSQEDDKLNKAKRVIASCVVAIMLAHLTPILLRAFYTPFNNDPTGGVLRDPSTVQAGAEILSFELFGVIQWVETLVVVLAILVIVVSAIRAVASFGAENASDQIRKAVIGTAGGLALLVFPTEAAIKRALGINPSRTMVTDFSQPNATPIILRAAEITQNVLFFFALVAVAVIIGAAFMMLANFGNEDQVTKAKSLIGRVLIGLIIILVSYSLAEAVLQLFVLT